MALELLTKAEIKSLLRIRGQQAWCDRKPNLIKSGMFRQGKLWLMERNSLEAYILRLENQSKKAAIYDNNYKKAV